MIGTICDANRPSAIACAARCCDTRANASCSSRLMLHFSAWFSAVMPMWPAPNGSVSAATIMSTILLSPMRAPLRIAGDRYPPADISSTPPARPISASPARMACATLMIACIAEPQSRLQAITVDVMAIPALTVNSRGT